jgi:hypothetical protein
MGANFVSVASKQAIIDVKALTPEEQADVAKALSLGNPDQSTSNKIWYIIIGAFSIAMLAAVFVLMIGRFRVAPDGAVNSDMILTIFTTTSAFLAGLFAPSPVSK